MRPDHRRALGLVLAFVLGLAARELYPSPAAAADDHITRSDFQGLVRAVVDVGREVREAGRACR